MRLARETVDALEIGCDYLDERGGLHPVGDPRIMAEGYAYLKRVPTAVMQVLCRRVPHAVAVFTMPGAGRAAMRRDGTVSLPKRKYRREIFDLATLVAVFQFAGERLLPGIDYRRLSEVNRKYWRLES